MLGLQNLVSAASSEIEATVGEHYPMIDASGYVTLDAKGRPILNYSLTHAIFMGCVFTGVIIISDVGREKRGKDFHAHLATNPPTGVPIDVEDIDALRDEEGEMDPRKRGSDASYADDMNGKEQLKKIGLFSNV
ncbi:unnamed protein product [Umbelopsis vinacea]